MLRRVDEDPRRVVHDELLRLAKSLGDDVQAFPCKTIVPLYRKHVFAQIKPTTLTRIDLGLALGQTTTPRRLIDTGGLQKKDRIKDMIKSDEAMNASRQ